jgi:hypothetical protein
LRLVAAFGQSRILLVLQTAMDAQLFAAAQNGANIKVQDKHGYTPLHWTVYSGHFDTHRLYSPLGRRLMHKLLVGGQLFTWQRNTIE